MGRDDDAAAPADCLTLVMPLQARAGMTNHEGTWPRLPGVSHRPPPEDEFQGVPEATFVRGRFLRPDRPAARRDHAEGLG